MSFEGIAKVAPPLRLSGGHLAQQRQGGCECRSYQRTFPGGQGGAGRFSERLSGGPEYLQ
ncbi:MAG: hypothetical protein NZ602_04905 [Thermoguttaceae bacterium]|nr:hypothetical protein [Thermoguttaceae bacterium]